MQQKYVSKLKNAESVTKHNILKLIGIILLKLAAGYATGMLILYTSALKSFSTIISLFAGWIGIKASQKTADKHFEYGYYKIETFAAFIASTLIVYFGFTILVESIHKALNPEPYALGAIGIIVVVFAITLSLASSSEIEKAAHEANLRSLLTSANYKKIDSLAYGGILAGAIAAIFGVPYIESILSGVIAIFILYISLRGFKNSLFSLLDYWRDTKLLNKVRRVLKSQNNIVEKIEQLKLRQAGPLIFGEALLKINSFANIKDVRNTLTNAKKDVLALSPYIQDFAIYTYIKCPEKSLIAIPVNSGKSLNAKLANDWSEITSILLVEVKGNKTKIKGDIKYDPKDTHDKLIRDLVNKKVNVFMWGRIDSLMYYTLERVNQIQVYPSFSNANTVIDAVKLFTIDS